MPGLLEDYFGPDNYSRLRDLARDASTRPVRQQTNSVRALGLPRELIGSNCRDPWGLHESAGGGLSLRLRGIALALRGAPVFRGFQAKPALIERRYSSKQSPRQAGAFLYVRIKTQAGRATKAFKIEKFCDLVRHVDEKPEWAAEKRAPH